MTYICYCYIVAPATRIPMGGIGVFWLVSTPAQVMQKYTVWYSVSGALAITLPCVDLIYCGLVDQVFPGINTLEQLITHFRVGIEVWAGTSSDGVAVDMYHRTLVAGAALPLRWAQWRLTDIGADPVNWIYARHCQFVGSYSMMTQVANPQASRL